MKQAEAFIAIMEELGRAREKHPEWPADIVHQAAVVAEEAGETVRAALNAAYHGDDHSHVRTEALQTAATCVRLLCGE